MKCRQFVRQEWVFRGLYMVLYVKIDKMPKIGMSHTFTIGVTSALSVDLEG